MFTKKNLDLCLVHYMSQPYFERVWGWNSHSRNGDLKVLQDSRKFRVRLQVSKHLQLRRSLYHWKVIEVYMSKMGSHDPFGHLKHKLWPKERPRVKLAIWLQSMGGRESTRFLWRGGGMWHVVGKLSTRATTLV
jgi:hypothetical protein